MYYAILLTDYYRGEFILAHPNRHTVATLYHTTTVLQTEGVITSRSYNITIHIRWKIIEILFIRVTSITLNKVLPTVQHHTYSITNLVYHAKHHMIFSINKT